MSIKSIPTNAFISQSTITSVKFGSQCSYVGINAFKDCISLKEINDDNSIEEIGSGAFAGTNLYSVIFNNLSTIGPSSFDKCSNLTYVNATNCQKIDNYAFQQCSNLQQIDIQSCDNIGMYAFSMCNNLKSVNINTSVEINKCAFYGCINLSDIDFKNCNKIGNEAFYMCSNIKIANLTNCIKGIGSSAFAGCNSLEQITLSQTTIGDCAFLNCNNLNKVYIQTKKNEKCIELGNSVFCNYVKTGPMSYKYEIISNTKFYLDVDIISKYEKHSVWSMYSSHFVKLPSPYQIVYTTNNNSIIKNQNINDSINIDSHTYDNTGNYGIITFKNKITSFNQQIFKGENTLTSVELPSYCVEIGNNEFEDCKMLNSFTQLSNILTKIGDYAFKNCESLKSFDIPETITDLGEGIFAGCSNIEKFEGKFTSYYGKAIVYNNTLISVAPKYNNETDESYYKISDISSDINRLGHYCFSVCKELRRVDIPYSTYIGDFAFEGCDNLREVHFYGGYPSGSIEFGENAFGIFKKDENGNYIVDENKIDFKIFIPEASFSSCLDEENNSTNSWIKVYKNYIYPEPSNKQIIYYTEEDNKNYNLIEINSGEIKINSFGVNIDIKSIFKIIIGEGITKINNDVFSKCKDLEYIYLPNSLTKIGGRVFQECEKLDDILIPNNVETIASDCFGKSGIKEFIINDGSKLKKISKKTFISCSNLSIVNLSKSKMLDLIDDYTFAYCENLTDVKLSNTIASIGDYSFAGCTKILSITLPSNLTKLGNYCLETGSQKTKIYIPKSLSTPPVFTIDGKENEESYPFGSTTENIPNIYVPSDLYDIYINDKYWCKYKDNIIKQ